MPTPQVGGDPANVAKAADLYIWGFPLLPMAQAIIATGALQAYQGMPVSTMFELCGRGT